MADKSENVRKKRENVKKLAEQEKTADADSTHSQPDMPEKKEEKTEKKAEKKSEGFFKRTWGKVKTGTSKAVRAFGKEADDMTDEEFNERLKDLEGEGNIGYASRYYKLIDELSQMPSLMALTKQSEGQKDKEEAVTEAVKETQKEESETVAPEKAKVGTEKAENKNVETAKADAGEAEKAETAKTGEAEKVETGKAETAKAAPENADTEKAETEKAETAKAEATEVKDGEAEAGKAEAAEVKDGEAEAGKAEAAEVKGGEADTEKTETEVAEGIKVEKAASDESDKEPDDGQKYRQIAEDTISTVKDGGKQAVNIYKTGKRQKTLEKLAGQSDETTEKGRELRYMASQAKKEKTQAGFDIASTAVNKVSELLTKYGSSKLGSIAGKIAGFVNQALAFGKDFMSKRIEKQSLKNGVKGLIGGTDAYKKLKEKYKLYGQDMRRAIRTATKHSSVADLVNSDRDKLSESYAKKAQEKDTETEDILGLAGGMDEKAMKKALGRA